MATKKTVKKAQKTTIDESSEWFYILDSLEHFKRLLDQAISIASREGHAVREDNFNAMVRAYKGLSATLAGLYLFPTLPGMEEEEAIESLPHEYQLLCHVLNLGRSYEAAYFDELIARLAVTASPEDAMTELQRVCSENGDAYAWYDRTLQLSEDDLATFTAFFTDNQHAGQPHFEFCRLLAMNAWVQKVAVLMAYVASGHGYTAIRESFALAVKENLNPSTVVFRDIENHSYELYTIVKWNNEAKNENVFAKLKETWTPFRYEPRNEEGEARHTVFISDDRTIHLANFTLGLFPVYLGDVAKTLEIVNIAIAAGAVGFKDHKVQSHLMMGGSFVSGEIFSED